MDPSGELETVFRLSGNDVAEVVEVLCEAFRDYPVMRFVLGTDAVGYEQRRKKLVHYFVEARVLRGEVLLGIGHRQSLHGAALVSRPDGPPSPPELGELREQVWTELGPSARARYDSFAAACAPFELEIPHIHLNMIGVRRAAKGKGLGRRLIEHVHLMSREDAHSEGVTLTTEDEANVSLYQHFGYEIVGHATVGWGLNTWGFFRRDTAERYADTRS